MAVTVLLSPCPASLQEHGSLMHLLLDSGDGKIIPQSLQGVNSALALDSAASAWGLIGFLYSFSPCHASLSVIAFLWSSFLTPAVLLLVHAYSAFLRLCSSCPASPVTFRLQPSSVCVHLACRRTICPRRPASSDLSPGRE